MYIIVYIYHYHHISVCNWNCTPPVGTPVQASVFLASNLGKLGKPCCTFLVRILIPGMKKNIKPPSDWYLAEMENNNSLNLKNRRKKMIILRWLAVTSHHSIMPVLAHDTQRSPQPEASPRVFLERQGPNGGTRANPWMHVENHISDWIDCIIPFSFTRCYANSNVFGWTSCPSGRQHDASLGCIQGRRRQTSKATSHKASEKGSDRMDWGPPPSPRHPKIQANFIPSNIIEGRSKALTDVPWFSQWKNYIQGLFVGLDDAPLQPSFHNACQ